MTEFDTLCAPTSGDLEKAKSLLQTLIRIDSSNPPGNEGAVCDVLHWELQSSGITPEIVGTNATKPNLVAKISAAPENRKAPPMVLSCHMDVVPVTNPTNWKYPPFSGIEADGCIWGRGSIDMKGFAVMALSAIIKLARKRIPINRDVIFVAVSDEEIGTEYGSKWLVNNRPDLLGKPEFVLNEVGGFTLHRNGHRFYPVQVAEKGVAWLRMSATGEPGHSSMAVYETSLSQIAEAISIISKATLPWHVTEPAVNFIEGLSQHDSKAAKRVSKLLFSKAGTSLVKMIPNKAQKAAVEAILRNTATPTRIHSSSPSINVVPDRTSVDIDGRVIPGLTSHDLITELRKILGDKKGTKYEFEVLRESPGVVFPTNTELYKAIENVVSEADPGGIVIPSMVPGFTDSSNYAKLGATCYGFYPLKLNENVDFASMFHGDNERIPVEGFSWGISTLMRLLSRFLTT